MRQATSTTSSPEVIKGITFNYVYNFFREFKWPKRNPSFCAGRNITSELFASASVILVCVLTTSPARAQKPDSEGTGVGVVCYEANSTPSGWSVKLVAKNVNGDNHSYRFEGECTYYSGAEEPAVKVKVLAAWEAATKTAKENVTVLPYYSNDVPGSISSTVHCDSDPWANEAYAFVHVAPGPCKGSVWNNDTPYKFKIDDAGFPLFGLPLTRGLGQSGIGSGSDALSQAKPTVRIHNAVWRPGDTAEMQFYGMKASEYQSKYDQLWKQNWRIARLNTYVENGARLYDAVWRPGTMAELQSYGMTGFAFFDKNKEMQKQGWRVFILNTYIENGVRHQDAIWRRGRLEELGSYGMSASEYQTKYEGLWKLGWRIHLLNTYLDTNFNDQRRYDAIWRRGDSPEVQLYGLDWTAYQANYDKLWKQGWRIFILNTYIENGMPRYDAIWRPGTNAEMQFYGMPFKTYQARYDELWKKNWRLYLLNTYEVPKK